MAILSEKLFIVREMRSNLEVYDFNNFNLGRKLLKVKELVDAGEMCSCKKNDCLYIMNSKKTNYNEVMKFSKEGKLLDKWPAKGDSNYMSATTEGNVIITVTDKQMLSEYSSNGVWVRDIPLPECINPWHGIKRYDRYIVSHGKFFDPLHRVCLVDDMGNVEKSFGREVGSAEDQLNMPSYFTVGSNGCIIVADLMNDRVLLLDSNLEFKAHIVPQYNQRFQFPHGVCVDEHRLVVAVISGDPKENIHDEASASMEKTVESDSLTEKNNLLGKAEYGKTKEIDPSEKIEEDCRVLVFNIQPLLQKYSG